LFPYTTLFRSRNAAPRRVTPQSPPDVEMTAPLSFARLAVALAQASRNLTNQKAHLLDLVRLDLGQRRVAQDFVAQVFRFLAAIEQQCLRNHIADIVAQLFQRGRESLGEGGVGGGQLIQIVAQALDAHLLEDTSGEYAPLGEIPDVRQR